MVIQRRSTTQKSCFRTRSPFLDTVYSGTQYISSQILYGEYLTAILLYCAKDILFCITLVDRRGDSRIGVLTSHVQHFGNVHFLIRRCHRMSVPVRTPEQPNPRKLDTSGTHHTKESDTCARLHS